MLYDAVIIIAYGPSMVMTSIKRTSRSHREQVLFGADSFLILPPLGL